MTLWRKKKAWSRFIPNVKIDISAAARVNNLNEINLQDVLFIFVKTFDFFACQVNKERKKLIFSSLNLLLKLNTIHTTPVFDNFYTILTALKRLPFFIL